MPVFTAPGVYSFVQDLSQYAAPISPTVCGMVGAARRGPVLGAYNAATKSYNTPRLITNAGQFVEVFGTPSPDMQGPYAAMLFLKQGNQLYYGRVVGAGSAAGSIEIDDRLTFTAQSVGAWGNGVAVVIQDSVIAGRKKVSLFVNNSEGAPVLAESFDNLTFDNTNADFYETVINKQSSLVTVAYDIAQTGNPANTPLNLVGQPVPQYLTAGSDGAPPSDAEIIGAQYAGYATGLNAFADPNRIDVSLLAAPGYSSMNVLSAINSITQNRYDVLGVVHGPLGLNSQEIIDWHNAFGAYSTTSVKVDSPTCALYWPWVEIYDSYNGLNVWVPPVGFALQRFAYTDNVANPWFAAAGTRRGQLPDALQLEFQCTDGELAAMYGPGNGNAVNPIREFFLDGIYIDGNRTMQRTASALSNIDVMRTVFYMKKVLTRACRVLKFEKNDKFLWDEFNNIVEPFCAEIKAGRGLEDFKVVCDATTNTNVRRQRGEMWGYVQLIPTITAEKIVIPFQLMPTGATLGTPRVG